MTTDRLKDRMARKTKEEAQDTRDRILNAAATLFYEKGVSRTTLEDIAEAAGLTRGAIYWHFKNKLDLFSALHEQLHGAFMAHVITTGSTETDQPLKQLEALCLATLRELDKDDAHRRALSIFTLKCDYSGDLAPFLEVQNCNKGEGMEVIHALFRKAIALGQLRPDLDENIVALSMFCYMCGIMSEYLRNPALFDMKKQAGPLVALFFRGLER